MKFLAVLAIALCPGMSLAQESALVSSFTRAFGLYFPGGTSDRAQSILQGLDAIPGIEGRWIESSIVFPEGTYDPEMAAKVCSRFAVEIAPTGRFGFTVTRMQQGEATDAVTTYSFAGGRTFSRTTDQEGFFELLYGDTDLATLDPGMIFTAVAAPGMHGYAQVRTMGDHVLVIEDVGGTTRIFTRCL